MRDEGITWRSWWDGGSDGPISKRLNLRAWPTIYVLDAEGVIRYKQLRGEELDEAAETLLDEMEAKGAQGP
jgi:hypothetical protein